MHAHVRKRTGVVLGDCSSNDWLDLTLCISDATTEEASFLQCLVESAKTVINLPHRGSDCNRPAAVISNTPGMSRDSVNTVFKVLDCSGCAWTVWLRSTGASCLCRTTIRKVANPNFVTPPFPPAILRVNQR